MPEKGQGAHPRKCTWSCEADPVDWRSTWLGSGWVMVGLWSAGVSLVTFWSWTAPANPARYYEVCLQDDLNAVSLILPQSLEKWESETLGNLLKGTQHVPYVPCRVRIQSRVPLMLNLVLLTVTLSRLSINILLILLGPAQGSPTISLLQCELFSVLQHLLHSAS